MKKPTEYIVFCDANEGPVERAGGSNRQLAIELAAAFMAREPHIDWWVESRTVIWEHQAEEHP